MKRVLCVVSSLNAGGAETFLMKVLRSIDKTEYMLDFIVNAQGVYDEEAIKLGSKIFCIPLRVKHPFGAFKQIVKIVKENDYQYFLKLCDTPIGVTDILAAKIGGAGRVSVRSCNASSNTSKKKELLFSVLRPLFNSLSDCKIAPSDLAAYYTFGKRTVEKGEVNRISNGVDLNVYSFDIEGRKKVRKEFNVDDNTILIGHIGRFNPQKNHPFLIDTFEKYHSINPNSQLILVGTGELFDEIKKMVCERNIKDAVIFTGIRKDIPNILSAMDLFLLPSFYEGMPNTVIEAQATGLNCIISDTITREANITGLVSYLSLNDISNWVRLISESVGSFRQNTMQAFLDNNYDINSSIKMFKSLVFGEVKED